MAFLNTSQKRSCQNSWKQLVTVNRGACKITKARLAINICRVARSTPPKTHWGISLSIWRLTKIFVDVLFSDIQCVNCKILANKPDVLEIKCSCADLTNFCDMGMQRSWTRVVQWKILHCGEKQLQWEEEDLTRELFVVWKIWWKIRHCVSGGKQLQWEVEDLKRTYYG